MPKVGDRIKILGFFDQANEPAANKYLNKEGTVTHIDSMGTLFGTWGGIGLLKEDHYKIIS